MQEALYHGFPRTKAGREAARAFLTDPLLGSHEEHLKGFYGNVIPDTAKVYSMAESIPVRLAYIGKFCQEEVEE